MIFLSSALSLSFLPVATIVLIALFSFLCSQIIFPTVQILHWLHSRLLILISLALQALPQPYKLLVYILLVSRVILPALGLIPLPLTVVPLRLDPVSIVVATADLLVADLDVMICYLLLLLVQRVQDLLYLLVYLVDVR